MFADRVIECTISANPGLEFSLLRFSQSFDDGIDVVVQKAKEFREFWDQRYDRLDDYLRTMSDDPEDRT